MNLKITGKEKISKNFIMLNSTKKIMNIENVKKIKTMFSFNKFDLKVFIISIITGLCNSIFHMVNGLQSQDSICSIIGINKGSLVGEGKFIACILDDITKLIGIQFCVPFINEFLVIIFVAAGSVLFLKIIKLSNLASIFVCIIMQCSSAILESIIFNHYCHMHYMGFILIVFAAFFIVNKNSILFVICFILSLGIYYAFIPFYVMIIVLYLLVNFLKNEYDFKKFFKDLSYFIILTIIAFAGYIILYRIYKLIYSVNTSSYMGISENVIVTGIGFKRYFIQILKAFLTLPYLLIRDWAFFNNLLIQKISIGVSYVVIAFELLIVFLKKEKTVSNIIIFIFLILGLIVGFGFSKIMSPLGAPTRSTYQLICIYLLPIIIYDSSSVFNNKLKKIIIVNSIFFVICMFVVFNRTHYIQYLENNYAKNYLNKLVLRIESISGYDEKLPVYFYKSPLLKERKYPESGMGFGKAEDLIRGRFDYSLEFFENYKYERPTKEQCEDIINSKEFLSMKGYPNDDSIKIINDIVVVKFSD